MCEGYIYQHDTKKNYMVRCKKNIVQNTSRRLTQRGEWLLNAPINKIDARVEALGDSFPMDGTLFGPTF